MIYGYVRVSHEKSRLSGLSIESQKQTIAEYCEQHGLGAPEFFEDLAVSAWKVRMADRPGGKQLLQKVKKGDHILFYTIDRAFRSMSDFSNTVPGWIKLGITPHFLDMPVDLGSAGGKLMLNIMASFAQFKSDIMSERQKITAAASKKKRQKRLAHVEEVEHKPKAIEFPPANHSELPNSSRWFTYARVSHVKSLEGGSLDGQRELAARYVGRMGGTVCHHYQDEAISAYKTSISDRPAGSLLCENLQPGDHVVVAKLDRAWRSMLDFARTWEEWKEQDVVLHLADSGIRSDDTNGELFMTMLAAFAKWESEMISRRTREVMGILRASGQRTGKIPPLCKEVRYRATKYLRALPREGLCGT